MRIYLNNNELHVPRKRAESLRKSDRFFEWSARLPAITPISWEGMVYLGGISYTTKRWFAKREILELGLDYSMDTKMYRIWVIHKGQQRCFMELQPKARFGVKTYYNRKTGDFFTFIAEAESDETRYYPQTLKYFKPIQEILPRLEKDSKIETLEAFGIQITRKVE